MDSDEERTERVRVLVEGVVQGVGFRPFVHRIARKRALVGWVRNRPDGVRIEAQGAPAALRTFVDALERDAPPRASISAMHVESIAIQEDRQFSILTSADDTSTRGGVPADMATCAECMAETTATAERRHRYPFTNCTCCGPRYSIMQSLPYDRPRTSMSSFVMCEACRAEYENPADRRFHAQPIACPDCGPELCFVVPNAPPRVREAALETAAALVHAGCVLAMKGLGGYQLIVDATRSEAVERLRERKRRESKPFAVMFSSLESARDACVLLAEEERILSSAEAPILLVKRRALASPIAPSVAPGSPRLGIMLPYTPLHRLLLERIGGPVVCTSGNLSEEPMCIADDEALEKLGAIADGFLMHNRPVVRPVDDSLGRVGPDGFELLRRARGYAPLPIRLGAPNRAVLAVGAQQKCAIALSMRDQVIISQHLGDVGTHEGARLLDRTVADLVEFFRVTPEAVACDRHPDYISTKLAERLAKTWNIPLVAVQHHHAHVASVMAERQLEGPVLGLAWDGTGFGDDGTVWGGEALICQGSRFRRFARLRPFPLMGSDIAIREPRRSALGLLFEIGACSQASAMFAPDELRLFRAALGRGRGVFTSSMGRLFDAVAALAGVRMLATHEGQAAAELEAAAETCASLDAYPLPLRDTGTILEADWQPLVAELLADTSRGTCVPIIAMRFHQALANFAVALADRAHLDRVVLSGGCFQNALLSDLVRSRLRSAGHEAISAQAVPPNDGGISLGQLFVAARTL